MTIWVAKDTKNGLYYQGSGVWGTTPKIYMRKGDASNAFTYELGKDRDRERYQVTPHVIEGID